MYTEAFYVTNVYYCTVMIVEFIKTKHRIKFTDDPNTKKMADP